MALRLRIENLQAVCEIGKDQSGLVLELLKFLKDHVRSPASDFVAIDPNVSVFAELEICSLQHVVVFDHHRQTLTRQWIVQLVLVGLRVL